MQLPDMLGLQLSPLAPHPHSLSLVYTLALADYLHVYVGGLSAGISLIFFINSLMIY